MYRTCCYLVTSSCLTLATLWTVACQAPLFTGFSRQEYWSGLPFPSPRDLPHPGIKPRSPTLQAHFLPAELPGKYRLFPFKTFLKLLRLFYECILLLPSGPQLFCRERKKETEVAHSCPTLCNPMDCSPPGFFISQIFQTRILEWVAISFSTESS